MGTGYTRNDTTNNIADGNVINAADLDGEFDAIVTALSTSGHTHDGTAAEGGPVTKIGPAQDIVISASIVSPKTDNALDLGTSTLEFKDLFLDGTAHIDTLDVDENANIDGNLVVGGNLTVAGTTAFNGGTITLGDAAGDNVVFGADINSSIIPNDVSFDLGSASQEWRDLFINGTAHIDTLDVDENATVAGTLGVTGIATFTDDIIIGDGKTIGSTSDIDAITIAANGQVTLTQTLIGTALDISGDIDVAGTTNLDVVDIDGAVDMASTLTVGGVVDITDATDASDATGDTGALRTEGGASIAKKLYVGTDLDVDGTTNLDIVDIDGVVDMASTLTVGGVVDITDATDASDDSGDTGALRVEGGASIAKKLFVGTDLDVDGTTNLDAVDIDGAVQLDSTLTVGANDQGYDVILYGDTASANMTWDTSTDDLIFNGAAGLIVPDGQFTLGSTAVSSTAAELNIVDGDTSATSTTVVDADRVIMNDNGTMVQVAVTDLAAYFDDEITAMPNLVTTAATTVGALDSGSITSNFGTIDTGASAITTTGLITGGSLTVDDVGVNGKIITMTGSSSDTAVFTAGTNGTLSITTTDAAAAAANITITADGTFEAVGTTITLDSGGTIELEGNTNVTGDLDVSGQATATGFTGTLDGVLGSGTAAAATVTTLDTSDAVNLNLTTDSTSSTSGALIVDGGVGIAKKLFVGTDFDVYWQRCN